MRDFHSFPPHGVSRPRRGSSSLGRLFCGLVLGATLAGLGATANAAGYNEGTQGDLSNLPGAPTGIGALSVGDNYVVGSTVPSGAPIPDGHGALTNQDNDFFTFTVPSGFVLSQFDIEDDTTIVGTDRFFLGIYSGDTSPVDPSNPSPAGLLGYTLPGAAQIGTDVLPALGAANEPGFPALAGFSGSLGAGAYTVWLVDGDSPVNYDLDLVASPTPEPAMWTLMMAGVGLTGARLRRRERRTVQAIAS
jgi:hypothetical protein